MRKGIGIEVTAVDRARLEAIVADRNSPQKARLAGADHPGAPGTAAARPADHAATALIIHRADRSITGLGLQCSAGRSSTVSPDTVDWIA